MVNFTFQQTNLNAVASVVYNPIGADSTGTPTDVTAAYVDSSVQFYGEFSGATIRFEGSDDPRANPNHPDHADAAWETVSDSFGNLIETTQRAKIHVNDFSWWVRPVVIGGDINTAITVAIAGRKTR